MLKRPNKDKEDIHKGTIKVKGLFKEETLHEIVQKQKQKNKAPLRSI